MAREVVQMTIPIRQLPVVDLVVDVDESHTSFNEPPCQQHTLTEPIPPITIADFGWLAADCERLLNTNLPNQFQGTPSVGVQIGGAESVSGQPVEPEEQLLTRLPTLRRHVALEAKFIQLEVGLIGVPPDLKRIVFS